MKLQLSNPQSIVAPAPGYSQAVLVENATRWLTISGQVGVKPDGTLAGDIDAQIRQCFANIMQVLSAHALTTTSLVKISVFLTDANAVSNFREIRNEMLSGHECASTLLVVSALANPDFQVEIEATAAG